MRAPFLHLPECTRRTVNEEEEEKEEERDRGNETSKLEIVHVRVCVSRRSYRMNRSTEGRVRRRRQVFFQETTTDRSWKRTREFARERNDRLISARSIERVPRDL